jgi:hypothetical protein
MNDRRKSPQPRVLTSPKEVFLADLNAALQFKRQFFWNAFKALTFNHIDGDYVEFGSHGGITFRLAFDQIRQRGIQRHMWAFDSFKGLPQGTSPKDEHPAWQRGAMATNEEAFHNICRLHGIPREQYTVVQGFYEDTLPVLATDAAPTNIALAYIDCDLYSSTKTVLEFLVPRLKHGMILAFDDYFCWSSTQISGERRASLELMEREKQWNFVRYRDYGWAGTSYLVEKP